MEPTSLIYACLVLFLTINEANRMLGELKSDTFSIANANQLRDWSVLAPESFDHEFRGVSSHVRTANFNFLMDCGDERRSFRLTRLHDQPRGARPVQDWGDDDGAIGVPRKRVSEKEAYGLARSWLSDLAFDVNTLERVHKPYLENEKLPLPRSKGVSSRFGVRWGGTNFRGARPWPVAEIKLNQDRKMWVTISADDFSLCRKPIPTVPHAVALNLLPDGPVREFFNLSPREPISKAINRPGLSFTNVFSLLDTPAQYEEAARPLLLAETKSILSLLSCSEIELAPQNLTEFYVNPPAFGFGGRMVFSNGEVRFDHEGRLRYFYFLPRGYTNHHEWLWRANWSMTTNDAYRIAVQRLTELSVDVAGLNRLCEPECYQWPRLKYDEAKKLVKLPSPEYIVAWRVGGAPRNLPIVSVSVYRDIGRVGRIELRDTSFWKRAPVVVPGREKWLPHREELRMPAQPDVPKAP